MILGSSRFSSGDLAFFFALRSINRGSFPRASKFQNLGISLNAKPRRSVEIRALKSRKNIYLRSSWTLLKSGAIAIPPAKKPVFLTVIDTPGHESLSPNF